MQRERRFLETYSSAQEDEQSINNKLAQSGESESKSGRSKRQTLKIKQMMKQVTTAPDNAVTKAEDPTTQSRKKQEETGGILEKKSGRREKVVQSVIQVQKMLLKPAYLNLSNNSILSGSFGHGTFLFKNPISQGHFFLQVIIKPSTRPTYGTIPVTHSSSIRLGVAPINFNPSFPLGCLHSLAYKSSNGAIIEKGEQLQMTQPAKIGDTIGICIKMPVPSKYENHDQISLDGQISFYRNGKLLWSSQGVRQITYCMAVSVYHYAQVELLHGPGSKYPMPEGATHFFNRNEQKITKMCDKQKKQQH